MNFKILVLLSLGVAAISANESLLAERILQATTPTTQTAACTADSSCTAAVGGGCCGTIYRNEVAYNNWRMCVPWDTTATTLAAAPKVNFAGADWKFVCATAVPAASATPILTTVTNCTVNEQCTNTTAGANYCCAQRFVSSTGYNLPATAWGLSTGKACVSTASANSVNFTGAAKTVGNNKWQFGTAPNNFTGDLQVMWNCQPDATSGAYFKATLAIFVALFAFFLY